MGFKDHQIIDYTYQLPESRIAKFPLKERDASKLLIYQDRTIREDIYAHISTYLPDQTLLVLNNTKVIPARIHFNTLSGALIELFCLEAADEFTEPSVLMGKTGDVRWKCLIGNVKKWKQKMLSRRLGERKVSAEIISRTTDAFIVEFRWKPETLTFSEVIEQIGEIPIPPYLKREAEAIDQDRYQTVYAVQEGSVAAPTAGLHFTAAIFQSLKNKHISLGEVSLHVGAGTFRPVKSETIAGHEMHAEWLDVSLQHIEQLLLQIDKGLPVIPVGTTSLRTLETLYWMGLKATHDPKISFEELEIRQWDPYELSGSVPNITALQALVDWLQRHQLKNIVCKTQIIIVPGYQLKIADAIITNFHQPCSTLLLLIAAIVGPQWKDIYDYAMQHDFRFLSYGDGSLLFAEK